MNSSRDHHWGVTAIGDATAFQTGVVATCPQAWMAALISGRAGLLAGDIETLTVTIDDQVEVLLDPARDSNGLLDVPALTAERLEMYQSATADDVLERLIP